MENGDFLRKQVELAQSSQSSIEGLYSLAAEVARFYFAIASIFPHFFNTLFGAYVQGLIFSRVVSRIGLSRFIPVLPRNFLVQGEARREEEKVQAENATPYIPFMLNSTLAQILTSDISEPYSPEIEIGREPTEPLEKASETYPVYSFIQWQTELLNKVAPSLKSIRSARVRYEEKSLISKPILSKKSTPQPATAPKEEGVGKLSEEQPEITPATHVALWQHQLTNMAFPSLQNMLMVYARYQRLGVSSALPVVTPALAPLSLASPNIATSAIPSAPFETPSGEKAIEVSPLTETSTFWGKAQEIQVATEYAVRSQEIAAALQTAIALAVIAHSINFAPKPATIQVTGALVRAISPKEPAASSVKSLPATPKIDATPLGLPKELTAEESPKGLSTRLGLNSETLESLSESAKFPNLIFENRLPFLKIADTLSRISVGPETVSIPIHEVTYHQPATTASPVPMPQTQISLLLHEIVPSLTSWIYEGSEVLRDTGVPLSAVPIAASEAERVVSETLAEPTPRRVAAQPPIEGKPSAVPKRASRLPILIALAGAGSLISQRLSDELVALKKEAKIEKAVAMMRPVQDTRELPAVEGSAEAWVVSPSGRFVIAPVGAALPRKPAALNAVPVRSQSLWDKILETQAVTNGAVLGLEAARRAYELPILGYSNAAPQYPKRGKTDFWSRAREAQAMAEFVVNTQEALAAMQAELALSAIGSQMGKQISRMMAIEEAEAKARESSAKRARARLSKPYPFEPSVRNTPPASPPAVRTGHEIPTIDVTEPDETAEEDLRDLERKISRILSEQLSRYYGTSRM